ncbi:MAG: SatD family protein [Rhizomicrobium sp.]
MARATTSRTARQTLAVVMGDIIDSEGQRAGGDLSREFNSAIRAANKKYRAALLSPLTITLGDEFQGLVREMAKGFEIITKLRSDLLEKSVNCRFVLGIARLDTKINTENAWNMMGDGLAQARSKLNDKREPNVYRFSLYDDPSRQRLLDAVGLSLTAIEEEWTPTQRRYIRLNRRSSIGKTARDMGVGIRSVYKVLEAAKWAYYKKQKEAIEFALSSLDQENGAA